MGEVARRVFLTFPQKIIKEPIVYNLGHMFKVITNIRAASVTDEVGLVALELVGDEPEVERAIEYLVSREVKVEPMVE
ncbi:MAG: NIL domain-containing protein [Planctomycetota bacterium]